jgi:hypothetical protein
MRSLLTVRPLRVGVNSSCSLVAVFPLHAELFTLVIQRAAYGTIVYNERAY